MFLKFFLSIISQWSRVDKETILDAVGLGFEFRRIKKIYEDSSFKQQNFYHLEFISGYGSNYEGRLWKWPYIFAHIRAIKDEFRNDVMFAMIV